MNILKRKIKIFEESFFSLDLSDLSVKLFQLDQIGDCVKVRCFYNQIIPRGCIEDGRIIDKAKVAGLIRMGIKKASPKKINTRKVVCSLPESKAFLRTIVIPKMNPEEAGEAVKWEIEASIPMSVDQVYFDWQFIDEIDGRQNVLTVAVAKEVIDDLMGTLELAKLEVCALELESIATVRSLISKEAQGNIATLIVDLGAGRTSFIIVEGNVPYFTSSIPFSSAEISDVISKSMGVSVEEANKIKINHGMVHSYREDTIFSAMRPMLENLACEIEKTIDFYQNVSKTPKNMDKIIICGGGSNLKGLIPYLTARLGREVAMGNPWINLDFDGCLPPINHEDSVGYATAIGLALREK